MAIIYRAVKGSKLTIEEVDGNFQYLENNIIIIPDVTYLWINGTLSYLVRANRYPIVNTAYSAPETTITLDTAHGSLQRIDAIVGTISNTVTKKTGTPGDPSPPDIDDETEYLITYVIVPAGSTVPGNITKEDIYLENTEWTTAESTSGARIALASSNNPDTGTVCIESSSPISGDNLSLTSPSVFAHSDILNLTLRIRLKAAMPGNARIRFQWYLGVAVISSELNIRNGDYGLDNTNTSTYQDIIIPHSAFTFTGLNIDKLVIKQFNSCLGWYIDNVQYQTEEPVSPPPPSDVYFNDLLDVNAPTPTNGQVPMFNAATGQWEAATPVGSGDMLKSENLSGLASYPTARTNLGLDTTANQTDSTDKRFVTDAEKTVIGNTSGTNTGDQDLSGLQPKPSEGQFVDGDKTKLDHISVTQAVDLDQMETDIAALANGMVYKDDWDASVGTFPGGGVAQIGWFYYVSVGGTVDGIEFSVGDNIVAKVDNASTATYAANWSKHDQTDAVQSVAGLIGSITASGLRSALNVEDGAEVTDAANIEDAITSVAEDTLTDASVFPFVKAVTLVKITWANIKATLKTYFDALYQPLFTSEANGNIATTKTLDHTYKYFGIKTMTAATTFSDSNLVVDGITRGMYLTGNFVPTFPAYWEADPNSETYDGTVTCRLTWDVLNATGLSEDVRYTITVLAS